MQNISTTNEQKRYWLIFQCAPSSETRGFRPSHDGGCMKWNTRSTKRPPTGKVQMQANCKYCHRRPRISPKQISLFYVKNEAESECQLRNAQQDYEAELI